MALRTRTAHTAEPLSPEELQDLFTNFKAYEKGMIRLQPGDWFLYPSATKILDQIYDFEFRPTDVLVVTYPKCGTTWMQEIIWTMRHNPNLDHPMAELPVNFRSPFLDADMFFDSPCVKIDPESELLPIFHALCPDQDPKEGLFLPLAKVIPDPRELKTHFSISLLPPDILEKCKVVYVARNPLDVCSSYHHHSRLLVPHTYVGNMDTFIDYFIKDDVLYGSYWKHHLEGWKKRNHPNLLFLFYEDLKKNPFEEIKKIDTFLGTNLSNEQIKEVVDYTGFEMMKDRGSLGGSEHGFYIASVLSESGGFFRKAASDLGKEDFTEEQRKKIMEWSKNHLKDFEGEYKYTSLIK